MSEDVVSGINGSDDESDADSIAVDTKVIVYPGSDNEMHGTVVEDFAELAGSPVEIAGQRIVGPARRWAVNLDDGGLVFVDSESIAVDTKNA